MAGIPMSDLPNPQIRSGKEGIGLVAPHQLLIHEWQRDLVVSLPADRRLDAVSVGTFRCPMVSSESIQRYIGGSLLSDDPTVHGPHKNTKSLPVNFRPIA